MEHRHEMFDRLGDRPPSFQGGGKFRRLDIIEMGRNHFLRRDVSEEDPAVRRKGLKQKACLHPGMESGSVKHHTPL